MCTADIAGRSPPRGVGGNQGNIAIEERDNIAADEITDDDASATGQSVASSSTSLSSSIFDYRLENGRTYHKYKDGKYYVPNDERENGRLDLQHNMFIRTFGNRLGTAPPNDPESKVGRVLDVGTGTGIWAMEFGDEHPEAEVLGIDLSPAQPEFVPPNVRFEIDDLEERWTYSRPFDYIHSRVLDSCINDWKAYFQQSFDHLNPGGYLEIQEIDAEPRSDDGTLKDDSSLMKSLRLLKEAAEFFQRPFQDIKSLADIMAEVGFEDIHLERYKWPSNSWPKDRNYKELGVWTYENLAMNWEAFLMAPLTRALSWTKEEVMVLAMEARRDLGDKSIHAYFTVWAIHGRKPLKAKSTEEATAS
ncbi:hypothetical protein HER10_EVM0005210 [Colletotrichum scovillei]|uniref:uncharacterized protein n=1 Tax=Colletotrichum scovillei TaxID=1209932 RepID=UPI0015C3808E|nr:uncharacterized protein HER10_EVM0005210 [Colletotrichum scovillei]KAF4773839.1 hypothetical protein HER10_EVM0005210 [Colletotrichum scovillei]KAG7082755.1 methyltransferase domain-containing protein [Colletotrichum scovillei]